MRSGALLSVALAASACAASLEHPERFAAPGDADGGAPAALVDAAPAGDATPACPDVPTAVFAVKCANGGCHDAPHASTDNLDLKAPGVASRLVGVPAAEGGLLVDPAHPDQSVLYRRIVGGLGESMPPGSPLDAATTACVLAWIKAAAPAAPADAGQSTPSAPADAASEASTFSPIRVAAGAAAPYTDHDGNTWSADADFSGGDVDTRTNAVSGTSDAALYQSERWGTTFTYTFAVPDADYVVTLKFAEMYDGAQSNGQRVFDVTLNGQKVLSSFDIFATAGGYTAYDKSFPVTAAGGSIVLRFDGIQGAAKVDAIAVVAK